MRRLCLTLDLTPKRSTQLLHTLEIPGQASFWTLHVALAEWLNVPDTTPEFILKHSRLGKEVVVVNSWLAGELGRRVRDARKLRLAEYFTALRTSARYFPWTRIETAYDITVVGMALRDVRSGV